MPGRIYNTVENFTLTKLLLLYPNAPWNWYGLSSNPWIPLDFIMNTLDKFPWDINQIAERNDMTTEIFEKINDRDDMDWRSVSYKWLVYNPNTCKLIDKPNIVHGLSRHPALTQQIIEANIKLEWNWHDISLKSSIATLSFIKKYKDKNWDWSHLLKNNVIDTEFIINNNINCCPELLCLYNSYNDILRYNIEIIYRYLSSSHQLTIGDVIANIDKRWDWYSISSNYSISWSDIEPTLSTLPWIMELLSIRRDLTWDIVSRNLNAKWYWPTISARDFITVEIIESNITSPLDWWYFGLKKPLPRDFIYKWREKNFDWSGMDTICYDIDEEFIMTFQDKPLPWHKFQDFDCIWEILGTKNVNWGVLSRNLKNINRVLQYPNYPWSWRALSMHAPISLIPIEFRDWKVLSMNPLITADMVQLHRDEVSWNDLTYNRFEYASPVELRRQKRVVQFHLIRILLRKLPLVRRHIFSTIYIHIQRNNGVSDSNISKLYATDNIQRE